MRHPVEWRIKPEFYIFVAIMLLLLPLRWFAAALAAGFVHEIGHLLALIIFRIPVHRITLAAGGAKIYAGETSPLRSVVCAAAGPFAGAVLFLAFPVVPELAVCALLQTVYNLLPLPELDGGRALLGLLQHIFGPGLGRRIFCLAGLFFFALAGAAFARFNTCVCMVILGYVFYKFRNMIGKHLTNTRRMLDLIYK